MPADKRFVLIQNYGKWEVEPGSVLTTRGPDGRAANLLATGEHLGQFAAADLQSGEVQIGDPVFDRPEIQAVANQQTAISNLPLSLRNQVAEREKEEELKQEAEKSE